MSRAPPCPCASGEPYARCCEPFHRGEREAPTPSALMRSRYAAFAKAHADYLWRTLHPQHPDRDAPEDLARRAIRASAQAHRYPGLTVLDAQPPGDDGLARVLFFARVFQKGRDRSFSECSEFAHDGVGWRYLRGVTRAGPPPAATIAEFLRIATAP